MFVRVVSAFVLVSTRVALAICQCMMHPRPSSPSERLTISGYPARTNEFVRGTRTQGAAKRRAQTYRRGAARAPVRNGTEGHFEQRRARSQASRPLPLCRPVPRTNLFVRVVSAFALVSTRVALAICQCMMHPRPSSPSDYQTISGYPARTNEFVRGTRTQGAAKRRAPCLPGNFPVRPIHPAQSADSPGIQLSRNVFHRNTLQLIESR